MTETVKVNSFGAKTSHLAIDEEFIQFQEKSICRNEISGIQYWISAIQFYRFSAGTRYYIGLKTPTDQLDITLESYFDIGNGYFKNLCDRIVDAIWDATIARIWNISIASLFSGEAMVVGNCSVSKNGVVLIKNQVKTEKQTLISWEDLYYEKKYDKLVINHKNDQYIFTNLYYKNTWNIDVLMAVLDWITKEGGLTELQER